MLLESKITAENPSLIKGKKVLVVEDGPTVTHGEMPYGAGYLAAKQFGAKKIALKSDIAVGAIFGPGQTQRFGVGANLILAGTHKGSNHSSVVNWNSQS